MQDLQTSASEEVPPFEQLARPVQKWIRKQGWPALRDVQNRAIPKVLGGGDLIIAAATASGKTEAAFLPLISRILTAPPKPGFRAIYLAPLKSLVNDQHRRLESLCDDVRLPVHKWHGDVAQALKTHARKHPGGILLITPESLEATFVNRGTEVPGIFGGLEAVIIDELHAFIGTERGIQLASLLARLEKAIGRPVDRIGLSATLGDMQLAAEALRPATTVETVEVKSTGKSVDIVCSVFERARDDVNNDKKTAKKEAEAAVDRLIAEELFEQFCGSSNLIFANSRDAVETFSYLLRETAEARGMINEFLPHHGKLSKELREFAEREIRSKSQSRTIVATSTLEMGVDIGSVETVAQIDPPNSIASLRQRVGRSGRREGQKPALRLYVREQEEDGSGKLTDQLHLDLVQGLAVCELLAAGWCEPPNRVGLHLSTLVHQIMALIAQRGGCTALTLYQDLCLHGPFRNISPDVFQAVLRSMAHPERLLIEQASDGTLLLGRKGEKRIEHFTFYAVFSTPEEFRVVSSDVVLGTIEPEPRDLVIGAPIAIAGRRWDVCEVNLEAKTLKVVPSKRGHTKRSSSDLIIHERIAQKMRKIYTGSMQFDYLDDTGRRLLDAGRFAFKAAGLAGSAIAPAGAHFELFPWTGTRELGALAMAFRSRGIDAQVDFPVLFVRIGDYKALVGHLTEMASAPAPTAEELVGQCDLRTACSEKFDFAVPEELRAEAYLRDKVDLTSVPRIAKQTIG